MFKIKVKNQGYIKEAEVEFIPGLNVLRGKSSQGKSTLFRAIETTVFNLPSDYLVTYGEKKSSVTLDYNGHEIIRDRDLNAKEYKTVYYIDGKKYVKNGKNALEEVQENIGLKELTISGSKIHIAFSSAFGLPFLVDESPQKIFDFITFSSANLDISDVIQKIKSDISENKEETKRLEVEINTLKDIYLKQTKKNSLFEEYSNNISLTSELKELTERFDVLLSFIESTHYIKIKIDQYKDIPLLVEQKINYKELANLNELITKIKNEIFEIEKLNKVQNTNENILKFFPLFDINKFNNDNKTLNDISVYIYNIKDIIEKGRCLNKLFKIKFLELNNNNFVNLVKNINDINSINIKPLKTDFINVEKEIKEVDDSLKSFNLCPLCGAKIIH